jgi:hypothetical protein
VSYIISDDGVSEDVLDTASITQGTIFGVGVDVQKLKNLDTFLNILFSNTNELVLYVGGQETSTKTFSGNIYKVGLCSEISFAEISDGFDGSGILTSPTSYLDLLSKTASYTIVPTSIFNSIKLSVAANAYWQDYIPLSKLAKSVVDANGVESLSLDFIQLNFDHQEPRQYSSGKFDTSKQSAKTYVTFQTLASGSNKPLSDFTTTVLANETRIVNATTFSALSKYEFVNGMIIYPPTNVNLNTLAMVIHIELNNSDSNLKKFNFRRLQLAAQSFNKNSANPIGTKYGVDLYSDSGSAQNPYLVYKDNTPYLYLTKHSGFRMLGSTSNLYATLGSLSEQTKVSSIQMSILSDIKEFPTTSQKIFSITGNSGTVNFYVRALGFTDTTKGFIYSDNPDVGGYAPAYYLNGKLVANPVIELNEWNVLGVAFGTPVNISNKIGRLTIFSRLLIDNISVYNANPIEIDQKSTSILWSEIKGEANKWVTEIPTQTPGRSGNSITISTTVPHNLVVGEKIQILGVEPINYRNEWLDISTGTLYDVELSVSAVPSSTSFTYENSLTSAAPITTAGTVVGTWQYASIPNYYRINSNNIKSIYKIHLGTFKTVIDTDEESKKLMLSGYQYSAYTDVKINTITLDVL